MEEHLARTVITVYAVLNGIMAFVWFVFALAVTFLTPFAMTMLLEQPSVALPEWLTEQAFMQLARGISLVVGVIAFLLAALFLALAVGLWRRNSWARYWQLALCAPQLFAFPIGTLVGAFGIYAFGFDAQVREQFGVKAADERIATPSKKKRR